VIKTMSIFDQELHTIIDRKGYYLGCVEKPDELLE